MDDTPEAALRVALLAQDCQRDEFRALLENEGIEVVLDGCFDFPLPQSWNGAEVLLVDMDRIPKRHEVESVLRQVPVPVLLNSGGIGKSSIWQRRLMGKLQTLAERAIPSAQVNTARQRPDLHLVQEGEDADGDSMWLVVLGASIGGPKAIARFLQALPPDLPAVLLLAQHISEAFQDLLVEQLDRCSQWPVALLGETQLVEKGQVWLVPSERRIEMDGSGEISAERRHDPLHVAGHGRALPVDTHVRRHSGGDDLGRSRNLGVDIRLSLRRSTARTTGGRRG